MIPECNGTMYAGEWVLAALSGSRLRQDNNAFKYGARWTDQACVSEEYKGTWTAGRVFNHAQIIQNLCTGTCTECSLYIFSLLQAVKFAIQQTEEFLAQIVETCSAQWKLRYAGRSLVLLFALTAN